MPNRLTRGKGLIGKMYGDVAASAGAISSTEVAIANTKVLIGGAAGISAAYALSGDVTMNNVGSVTIAAGAVTSSMLGAGAVSGAKYAATWSTLSNSTKSVSIVKVDAANRGYFVTNVGSSKGIVIQSTVDGVLAHPTAGTWLKFLVGTTPSTIPIHVKSTGATFDGSNGFLLMNAVGDCIVLEALSTTRWLASYNNSVAFAAAT